MNRTDADDRDRQIIERQLGRMPRGVVGVAARCVCQAPLVVTTAPRLPDGSPFPTLYYLSHPVAVKGCSILEAQHWMDELNAELGSDEELRSQYARAHNLYIAAREKISEVPEIAHFSAGGMPERIKCLHAVLAHTLAAGHGINPIGDRVLRRLEDDGLWSPNYCSCATGQRRTDERNHTDD